MLSTRRLLRCAFVARSRALWRRDSEEGLEEGEEQHEEEEEGEEDEEMVDSNEEADAGEVRRSGREDGDEEGNRGVDHSNVEEGLVSEEDGNGE